MDLYLLMVPPVSSSSKMSETKMNLKSPTRSTRAMVKGRKEKLRKP